MRAVSVRIEGIVQQVGFRYHTVRAARDADVVGWVRNQPDGSVEVWAQGAPEAVSKLVTFLEGGPPGARVTRCLVDDANPDPTLIRFDIRM